MPKLAYIARPAAVSYGAVPSMKKKISHPDDVSIGKDEWIRFIEHDSYTDTTDLDGYISTMRDFWSALELNCVSGCCGISAYSFWPEDIRNAGDQCGVVDVLSSLGDLRRFLDTVTTTCVVSRIMNQYFDRSMFCTLLDHVIKVLESKAHSSSRIGGGGVSG